jgi:tetratricopeptide (TPR) repeat protein
MIVPNPKRGRDKGLPFFRSWRPVLGAFLFWFLLYRPAQAAEPGNFDDLRAGSVNLARDGHFVEALGVEQRALQIEKDRLGPIHPTLAPIYLDLGTLDRDLGRYPEAEREYRWGLALLEREEEPADPAIGGALELLAGLEEDLGRFQEAALLETRALSIRKGDETAPPLSLAQSAGNLGRMKLESGRMAEAVTLLRWALKRVPLQDPRGTDVSLNLLDSLARAYRASGDPEKARDCLKRALNLARSHPHSDRSNLAEAEVRLADFLKTRGPGNGSENLYQDAFQIDRHNVGSVYDFDSLPYLIRLAEVETALERKKESQEMWQKILQTVKAIYGPDHPKVAMALVKLAKVEISLDKASQAGMHLHEALRILKIHFSPDHPLVAFVESLIKTAVK